MTYIIPDAVIERFCTAQSVTVLTGTGVALESGIPTFRDAQKGEWAHVSATELATPQAFVRNPRLVWNWYLYRRRMIEAVQPGPIHYALVDLEQQYDDFLLITQSIDGLHWRAGSRDLLELHGNISRSRCFDCSSYQMGWDEESEVLPTCVRCGGLLRPDVVWLGEGLPELYLSKAYNATRRAQVFLSVGASPRVPPAASLPLIARRAGAYVVEVHTEETALSGIADCWLQSNASDVLQELVQRLNDQTGAYPTGGD
jgi:NAD-dependent deacetylase